jgi:hypothetical protein
MSRFLRPLTITLLQCIGRAFAQPVYDTIVMEQDMTTATGFISGKVEALIEAIIVVILMLVRGFSDPTWKTTFFNLTNLSGLVQALNAIVIIFSPNGIPSSWQMLLSRLLLVTTTLLFARKQSVGQRINDAVNALARKPEEVTPPVV